MSVIHVNYENFDAVVKSGTVLVDFFATWCGPCKMIAPILEEVAEDRPDIPVVKVDVDESGALAARFGIVSIPTLVVLKDGQEVNRLIGYKPKAAILDIL